MKSFFEFVVVYKYILFFAATYPLDLAKTRLQIQGEKGLSAGVKLGRKDPGYRGLFKTGMGIGEMSFCFGLSEGFSHSFLIQVREEGFFRLWYGLPPALVRHAS